MKTNTVFFKVSCFLIFNGFLLCAKTKAQTPLWSWAKSAGNLGIEYANSIATDAEGSSYVTGYFNSTSITFGADVLNNSSVDTSDIFIAKYDVFGNPLWAKRVGGNLSDRGLAIASDLSGNVYVTGYFESATISFDSITLTNTNALLGSDVFIVKYGTLGNVIWAKNAGGNYTDAGTSLYLDMAGNLLVAGYFLADTISFDGYDLLNKGNYDMFVTKYDPNGNVLWADGRGGTNEDKAYGVTADASNNMIVTGAFLSPSILFDIDTVNYSGGAYTDIFTVKYTSGGAVSWANSEGGTYLDEPNAVVTDPAGDLYISGIFYSSSILFGTDTLFNSGTSFYGDMFIAKYDANGNSVWAKGAGAGTNNDWASAMDIDAAGNIWVAGVFGSTIIFDSYTLTNEALFMVEYDANGNAVSAYEVAGGMAFGISIDVLDNFHIAGIVYDPTITFGATPTLTSNGVYDIVVAQLGNNYASIPWNYKDPVIVYPNPTTDLLHLMGEEKITLVEIYNALGEKILSQPANEETLSIDMSVYSSGMYTVNITIGKEEIIKKIIR